MSEKFWDRMNETENRSGQETRIDIGTNANQLSGDQFFVEFELHSNGCRTITITDLLNQSLKEHKIAVV